MDRGAWRATVHGVAKGRTGLKLPSTQGNHPGWEGMAQSGPLGPPSPTVVRRWEELLHLPQGLLSQWLVDGRGKRGPHRRGSVGLPAEGQAGQLSACPGTAQGGREGMREGEREREGGGTSLRGGETDTWEKRIAVLGWERLKAGGEGDDRG